MSVQAKLSQYAWDKLVWMRDRGSTEVFGFGITDDPNDPMLVTDIRFPPQEATSVSADMSDEGFAEFVEQMADEGLQPVQCTRFSIHTHPGNSASPSGTDREMVEKIFSRYDWGVMIILARGGELYGELSMQTPLGGRVAVKIGVGVQPENLEYIAEWEQEYVANVKEPPAQTFDWSHYDERKKKQSETTSPSSVSLQQEYRRSKSGGDTRSPDSILVGDWPTTKTGSVVSTEEADRWSFELFGTDYCKLTKRQKKRVDRKLDDERFHLAFSRTNGGYQPEVAGE